MVIIKYRNHGIRITDVWFADCTESKIKTDILRLHGIIMDNSIDNKYVSLQHTYITNLSLSEEKLKAAIKSKNFKYEIRRSERDVISIRYLTSKDIIGDSAILEEFKECYDQMFKTKGLKVALNIGAIRQYVNYDSLIMSVVYLDDKPIVFHSYIVDAKNVRLFHSCSSLLNNKELAQVISRSNKRLHWEDLLYFKKNGFEIYDWGGVFSFDSTDGIDKFKQTFGGDKLNYYNVDMPMSLIGKLAQIFRNRKHIN